MLELNLAIRPIMWKNMANYLERIQIFIIFADDSVSLHLCGLLGQYILDKCFASVAHWSFRNSSCHKRSAKGRFLNVIFYTQISQL